MGAAAAAAAAAAVLWVYMGGREWGEKESLAVFLFFFGSHRRLIVAPARAYLGAEVIGVPSSSSSFSPAGAMR